MLLIIYMMPEYQNCGEQDHGNHPPSDFGLPNY